MSDSRRAHRAIKTKLKQLYPQTPQVNLARHLETLAFMVSGIILSQSCQLPKIASKVPGDVHPESRVKQLSRWVQNESLLACISCLLCNPCWSGWPWCGRWCWSWMGAPSPVTASP